MALKFRMLIVLLVSTLLSAQIADRSGGLDPKEIPIPRNQSSHRRHAGRERVARSQRTAGRHGDERWDEGDDQGTMGKAPRRIEAHSGLLRGGPGSASTEKREAGREVKIGRSSSTAPSNTASFT